MNISQRFYDNVKFLTKLRGYLMTELEKMAGASYGYLSRAAKKDSVSLKVAYRIAEQLNESVMDLAAEDYEKIIAARIIREEIDKLKKRLEEIEGVNE